MEPPLCWDDSIIRATMTLKELLNSIKPVSEDAKINSAKQWDSIAKPLASLGLLETTVVKLAGIFGTPDVRLDKRCVVVMCADNGVVAQGVTQTDNVVTTIMAENFVKGTTSVCTMAKYINMDVIPIDIGTVSKRNVDGLLNKKIMYGTLDMTEGPAMSHQQAMQAIEVGIETVARLKEEGYNIIATGEMGIGNTTSSSAIASVLLGQNVETVTGCGAGLDNAGLLRKIDAIKRAIAVNQPDENDALDVLSKVGGLDIAGMVGLYIGGAVYGMPIMLDGFISGIAAIIAARLNPLCMDYMIASHVSAEPAGKMVLDTLSFLPLVTAGMCLGEGTGAVAALSLIDMALEVYHKAITFPNVNIEEYVHFK